MKRRPSRDLIARAYATLGLPPGTSRVETARRYKLLIRRWHPDQYASDPIGQAEAAQRTREINAAYALLRHAAAVPTPHEVEPSPRVEDTPSSSRTAYFGHRLSEADLREIADAIGTPQYFGTLMRYAFWGSSIVFGSLAMLAAPRGQPPRAVNVLAGFTVLCAAAGHLIYTLRVRNR
jgi:hypothetical protein